MPSGLGIWWRENEFADEQAILDELGGPGEDPTAVIPLAMDAIVKLAAAQDIELTIPDVEPPPGGVKQPASHFGRARTHPRRRLPKRTPGARGCSRCRSLLVVLAAAVVIVRRRLSSMLDTRIRRA